MQITIYIYHTGAPDDPSKLTDTLVDRIEYAGQTIFFENGKIRVETIEEPADSARCAIWDGCAIKRRNPGCPQDCVHRVEPDRRPNMPTGMHL